MSRLEQEATLETVKQLLSIGRTSIYSVPLYYNSCISKEKEIVDTLVNKITQQCWTRRQNFLFIISCHVNQPWIMWWVYWIVDDVYSVIDWWHAMHYSYTGWYSRLKHYHVKSLRLLFSPVRTGWARPDYSIRKWNWKWPSV